VCEYCGCQQIAAIAELTREHDAVVRLTGRATRCLDDADPTAAAQACRDILDVLAVHTVVEEQGLFPALVAEFPHQVEGLLRQHRDIEQVLHEAVDGLPTDAGWPRRARQALYTLREHILAEQDGVFPAALARLDAADWDRIDEVRRQAEQVRAGEQIRAG
jgi:hemerythrin-like domain-containing protein